MPAQDNAIEKAIITCPQCAGDGSLADGLDEAACSEQCTRCDGAGVIVDVTALFAQRSPASSTTTPIPDDGSRGPEWAAMEARHRREGVTYWHADRVPGATDEQLAESMNRVAELLAIPELDLAAKLRGEAMIIGELAEPRLNFDPVSGELTPMATSEAQNFEMRRHKRTADLFLQAATLLEHAARSKRLAVEQPGKLAPCPRCEGTKVAYCTISDAGVGTVCHECHLTLDSRCETAEEACAVWNRRGADANTRNLADQPLSSESGSETRPC